MMSVLKLPLVLFIVVSFEGFLGHTLAQQPQHCSDGDKLVREGESQMINAQDLREKDYINLFVKPLSKFEGIRLHVNGSNGYESAAWFPAKPQCFQEIDSWQQLSIGAERNEDNTSLSFIFQTGTCNEECLSIGSESLQYLSVEAYGPSKWILKTPPHDCEISYLKNPSLITNTTCMDRPPSTKGQSEESEGLSPGAIAGIVVGLLVVAAAAVGVGVFVYQRRHKQIQQQNSIDLLARQLG